MSDAQQTRTPSAGLAAAKRSRRLSDVGVLLPHDMKPAELAGFAQSVERLGFDSLWIPENSFLAGGIAAAGLALGATTDLHIGLGVLPAPTRHPATMAMEISTIAGAHPGRLTAGIGNIFKSEACWAARVDPWHELTNVSDDDLRAVLEAAREQMLAAVELGDRHRFRIYKRRGPCSRCRGTVRHRGQGDGNRTTWWCERCQV